MTIGDFLELCVIDDGFIAVYNITTEETIICELGEPDIKTLDRRVLDSELVSWDFIEHDGERVICLNYEA